MADNCIVATFFITFAPAMKTTAKIFIFILFLTFGAKAYSQTYVKLNALYAAVGVINPQVESVISPHSSMVIDITASPWRRWNGDHSQFLILLGEYRYYIKQAAEGWYVSANAGMMGFDLNRLQFFKGGKLVSRQEDYGKGFGVAAGIGFGWQRSLSDRWCVDMFFSFDRMLSWYNRYSIDDDINMHPQGHEHYLKPDPFNASVEDMPIKLGVSFGYKIIDPNKKK